MNEHHREDCCLSDNCLVDEMEHAEDLRKAKEYADGYRDGFEDGFREAMKVERAGKIMGEEQDKFEEWIKTWIKEIAYSPVSSRKDRRVATRKVDILVSCLRKYQELKEKGEI